MNDDHEREAMKRETTTRLITFLLAAAVVVALGLGCLAYTFIRMPFTMPG